MFFEAVTEKERELEAIEALRVDVQVAVHQALEAKNWTQKKLAQHLRMSEQRVSQLFSMDSNMTITTLAKICHALGMHCSIQIAESAPSRRSEPDSSEWLEACAPPKRYHAPVKDDKRPEAA